MEGTTYGYVRVSTQEQHEARQIAAMRDFGVAEENIIVEKLSGKDFNRPRYQQLVRSLAEDDVLVVKSIDRLGRNYAEILEQWGMFQELLLDENIGLYEAYYNRARFRTIHHHPQHLLAEEKAESGRTYLYPLNEQI